jgi:hypothetical protein
MCPALPFATDVTGRIIVPVVKERHALITLAHVEDEGIWRQRRFEVVFLQQLLCVILKLCRPLIAYVGFSKEISCAMTHPLQIRYLGGG